MVKIAIEINGLTFWKISSRKDEQGNIILSCKDIENIIYKDYKRLKEDDIEINECLFSQRSVK